MCRLGSKLTFEEASSELNMLLPIESNAKQIERLCHKYGQAISDNEEESPALISNLDSTSTTYCMADGSMILTREGKEKWKELKLGRVFSENQVINNISKDRNMIGKSTYCAHIGSAKEFWEKFSNQIPVRKKLVFVCDGAKWLWNYIKDFYPNSTQILDFFHCKQHLYEFSKQVFSNKEEQESFVSQVINCFNEQRVDDGLTLIRQLKLTKKNLKKEQEKLLNYLTTNKQRIDYGKFKQQGLLIGSGAIEAAHRNVVQKRLKLSGQRWTIKGAQQVVNLRVCEKSERWEEVINLINGKKMAA